MCQSIPYFIVKKCVYVFECGSHFVFFGMCVDGFVCVCISIIVCFTCLCVCKNVLGWNLLVL